MDIKVSCNVQRRLNEQAAIIRDLISKVRQVTGENGSIPVQGWTLGSHCADGEDNIFCQKWQEDDSSPSGGWWRIIIVSMPRSKTWRFLCLADKAWDGVSTDLATLEHLKGLFEIETKDLQLVEGLLEKFHKEHEEVFSFFS